MLKQKKKTHTYILEINYKMTWQNIKINSTVKQKKY